MASRGPLFSLCRAPGRRGHGGPWPRPSPSSQGLAGPGRPGGRGGPSGWRPRTGFGLNGRPQRWPAEPGSSLPRGCGGGRSSWADLAALGRRSAARRPSLASPPASRGPGARGERHRAARLCPASSPRSSVFPSCACPARVSEGQSMPLATPRRRAGSDGTSVRLERVPGVRRSSFPLHALAPFHGADRRRNCGLFLLERGTVIRIPRERKPPRNGLHFPFLVFACGPANNFVDYISYGHLLL